MTSTPPVSTGPAYTRASLARPLLPRELPRHLVALHHAFGLQFTKRNNLHFLAPDTVLTAVGNAALVWNTTTNERQYVFGNDGRGVGAVAVHPSRKFFAVAEKGDTPHVYIYTYPEMEIHRVLRKGTERAYSAVAFSGDGDTLASVGAFPDFLLSVWAWDEERIVLRSKAFAQEVFNVSFSPVDSGRLTTSGVGHIRFWQMAGTFTGLKLKGAIGKFGKVELTDVDAFTIFPDGKVLSSTELGSLLLWEGNMIKCQIASVGGAAPHAAAIRFVGLDQESQQLITGGDDGYVKWWPFDAVDQAELDEDEDSVVVPPTSEVFMGDRVKVVRVIKSTDGGHYVVQDASGGLWRIDVASMEPSKFVAGHGGAVTGLDASPTDHFAATAGADGTVRCWDYVDRKLLFTSRCAQPASSLRWVPKQVDASSRSVAVGFDDGVLRVFLRAKEEWKRLQVLKPHTSAVTAIEFAPNGKLLATGGADGTLFLIRVGRDVTDAIAPSSYDPIGFVTMPGAVSSVAWRPDSKELLVACGAGGVARVPVPDTYPPTTATFDLGLPFTTVRPQLPPPVVEAPPVPDDANGQEEEKAGGDGDDDDDDDDDDDSDDDERKKKKKQKEAEAEAFVPPEPIDMGPVLRVMYSPRKASGAADGMTAVLVVVDGVGSDALHEGSLPADPESATFIVSASHPTSAVKALSHLSVSHSRRFVVTGGKDGAACLRPVDAMGWFARANVHDGDDGTVNVAVLSYDDAFLLTASADGVLGVSAVRAQDVVRDADAAQAVGADVVVELKNARPPPSPIKASLRPDAATGDVTADGGADGDADADADESKDKDKDAAAAAAEASEKADADESKVGDDEAAAGEETKDGDDGQPESKDDAEVEAPESPIVPLTAEEAAVFLPMTVDGLTGVAEFAPPPSSVPTDVHDESKEAAVVPAPDITDPEAYSIQDAKLKTEEDNRRAAAQAKQAVVRDSITALRARFADLAERNAAEPDALCRLTPAEMEVNPTMTATLHQQGAARVAEVFEEMKFDSEKLRLLEVKLRNRFLAPVEVESVRLHAFRSAQSVRSFRTTYLSEQLTAALTAVHSLIDAEHDARSRAHAALDGTAADSAGGSGSASGSATNTSRTAGAGAGAGSGGNNAAGAGGESKSAADGSGSATAKRTAFKSAASAPAEEKKSSFQQRKELRVTRQAALAKLAAQRPGPDAEDPVDVAAVKDARERMGDYKLKSDPNYEVPPERRVDAAKKERQMVLLEESIHAIEMRFNRRLLALRSLKKAIAVQIATDNEAVARIDAELETAQDLWDPSIATSEWPEWRDAASDADLAAWRAAKDAAAASASADDAVVLPPTPALQPLPLMDATGVAAAARSAETLVAAAAGNPAAALSDDVKRVPAVSDANGDTVGDPSAVELARAHKDRVRLEATKTQILARQQTTMDDFDEALYQLRRERLRLQADLKSAGMRLVYLYQELVMLQQMAREDSALTARLEKATKEQADLESKSADCNRKLLDKKAEVEVWQEKDTEILSDFHDIVPESHAAHAALLKIFKRKIKRAKKRVGDDDDDDDSDSDFSDDSDFDDEDEEEEADSCPPGCDQSLYDKVLELREKRLDQEDVLADFQKAIDDLQKTHDRYSQKLRQVMKDLDGTNAEIRKFQTEKQQRLNQIEVMLSLTLSQIMMRSADDVGGDGGSTGGGGGPGSPSRRPGDSQASMHDSLDSVGSMDGGGGGGGGGATFGFGLPTEVDDYLCFGRDNLVDLRARIGVLREENKSLRWKFKDLHRQRRELAKERKTTEQGIAEWQQKAKELQMLKFGQEVELESLDKMAASTKQRKLESELAVRDTEQRATTGGLKKETNRLQLEMLRLTQDNTKLLRMIGDLTAEQAELERELNARGNVVDADGGPGAERELHERQRLMQLVKLQANEMEVLKAEIGVLRRKGGHVYTQTATE